MCGRFIQISNPEKIKVKISELEISKETSYAFTPRYNIAPTQNILTVLNHQVPKLVYTRWGLVPFWSKDISIGSRMINARCETLLEKASFRTPLRKNRCIIFADGFFEWKTTDKSKTPYFIHLKDSEPFALAGLWDQWTDRATGTNVVSSTIITTSPNDLIKDIHNRMPVILDPHDYQTWLSMENLPDNVLMACLKTYPSEKMDSYEISRMVNSPANDNPEIIQPYAPGTDRLF
ncbi:MAG: SOS response-associated peptidase [Deltaproteobacteria bacterium]|nr:SOS response-associated peptidase [Deltaproteobacteria bacterium]